MTETPLCTAAELANATGAESIGPLGAEITNISIDSRTIAPGEAFFAIRGDRFDGHDFVADVLAKGAALAVVARSRLGTLPADGRYLVVDDVMDALRGAAGAARARTRATCIAVTGSVGKTSTKEALRHVLATAGTVHAAAASFNNHWGVPLTLARLPKDADFGVFEIGMNHAGEITPLTELVRPDIAIVTTVAGAHLENFDSLEQIAHAKAEIFRGLVVGGTALVNADNRLTPILRADAESCGVETILSFGAAADADARLVSADVKADASKVTAVVFGDEISFTVGAPGRHLVQNALAVLAAAKLAGADLHRAAAALASIKAAAGRGARHRLALPAGGEAQLIDESYNANPTSMHAAFELLKTAKPVGDGRRIAVLGDMLELGDDAAALHGDLAAPLRASGCERAYLSGPLMGTLWERLPPDLRAAHCDTAEELAPLVLGDIRNGDVVLAKGSNGSRTRLVVKALLDRYKPSPG